MSLVEQTIARLKLAQRASANLGAGEPSFKPGAADASTGRPEEPASAQRPIASDENALRAAGYLPEPLRDRQLADQYRRIKRPLIEKALAGNAAVGEARVVMVTSALPGDGKTFTAMNLALSMAQERDISVLLIDCDLPRRQISEVLGLAERAGLMDALLDEKMDVESLIVPTTTRGLSILPAGRRAAGAVEHLSSNRMRKVIADLCTRNARRIVLLDTPPLIVTNEARALVKVAGQVVLVVRAGKTPRPAVQAAIALFDPQQAGGIVLNEATLSSHGRILRIRIVWD